MVVIAEDMKESSVKFQNAKFFINLQTRKDVKTEDVSLIQLH